MKKEKITLIKPKKNKENKHKNIDLISSIIMFIIGLILLTNSSKAVIIVCYCIGAAITAFGSYNLFKYYSLKKELNIEDNVKLILGVTTIFIGIVIIILASAIETFLRFIIGIILVTNGIKYIKTSIDSHNYLILTTGIVLVAIGLYTILAENIIFAIVGLLLITSSIIDIIKYFKNKK